MRAELISIVGILKITYLSFTFVTYHYVSLTAKLSSLQLGLPWFRVHVVILNDPGRLISVHIMHTAIVSRWAASMTLYELITIDPTDPVYNAIWRQGSYVLPFISRLGAITSGFSWELGIEELNGNRSSFWSYETVNTSHLVLSGLCIVASIWH